MSIPFGPLGSCEKTCANLAEARKIANEAKGCTAADLETENRTLRLALIRCIAMHGPQHIEEHYQVLADPLRLTITPDERGGLMFDVVDRCGS